MRHEASRASDLATTDPVCGMQVDPATSEHRVEHGGEIYHFCSAHCAQKFAAEPMRYLEASGVWHDHDDVHGHGRPRAATHV